VPINSWTGKRDLEIRYSGIASAEGLLAVKRLEPLDTTLAISTAGACDALHGFGPGYRAMYASARTTVCKQVHVGTSDVDGESLIQSSNGEKFGPLAGYNFVVNMNGVNTSSLWHHSTVVVPFGFFVNSAVTVTKCTAGLIGNYCLANIDCNTAPGNATGTCGATTIKNISRIQAAQIFSGSAADWSDFGAYYTPQQVVVCLRHAGSGTHSALDITVMSGGDTGWGTTIASLEDKVGAAGKLIAGGAPQIWFNQSTTDEIKCINGNTSTSPTGSLIGAIGYADADQAIGVATISQNVKQLAFNGVYPTRSAVRNGLYEFYTAAQLYTNRAVAVNAIAEDLITYTQNPANIPAAKANYWATASEMNYLRASDAAYPGFTGATQPQLP
jgi:hypothetical protein